MSAKDEAVRRIGLIFLNPSSAEQGARNVADAASLLISALVGLTTTGDPKFEGADEEFINISLQDIREDAIRVTRLCRQMPQDPIGAMREMLEYKMAKTDEPLTHNQELTNSILKELDED